MIRKCKVCQIELNNDNTYKGQAGLMCKVHHLEAVKAYQQDRKYKDQYNAYRRKKYKEDEEYREWKRTKNSQYVKKAYYGINEAGREALNKASKKARMLYPEKWDARSKARQAVKKGLIDKLPCAVCGEEKVQAHHEDYSKPLDVVWYCVKHHVHRHYEIKGRIPRG